MQDAHRGGPALVWDLDTTLPFPCPFPDYVRAALRWRHTEGLPAIWAALPYARCAAQGGRRVVPPSSAAVHCHACLPGILPAMAAPGFLRRALHTEA